MILLLITICIHSVAPVTLKPKHLIHIKDAKFEGEDTKITGELSRRLSANPTKPIQEIEDYRHIDLPQFLTQDEDVVLNMSSRRRYPTYFNHPSGYAIKVKILDMIRQAIYATQYKLVIVDSIMEKHVNDPEFRMGYMFSKVEEWVYDMKVIYTAARKKRYYNWDIKKREFRVYKHIIYYEHMLRRNIDVTYTVEEIIRQHTQIHLTMASDELEN